MIEPETYSGGLNVPEARGNISSTLLQRVARGDRSAVETAVLTYGNMIWTIARTCSESSEKAENLTLEIFRDLWLAAHWYDADRIDETVFVKQIAARRALRKYGR